MPTGPEVAVLAYHDVADDPTTSGFQRPGAWPFKLSRGDFLRHLDRLADLGIRPGPVDRIDLRLPGRHHLLTFDDGGSSAAAVAGELSRRGWAGHFFVITGLIGQPGFLDRAGIRRLREAGHLVGSHSHTHPDIFRALSRAAMLEEWKRSAGILEDLLGEPCLIASVPGGDISATALRTASDAGFTHLFTSEPMLTPRRVGTCWVLGRVTLKTHCSAAAVGALAQFRGWERAMLSRRLKGLARTLAPGLYRQYVRLRTRERTGHGLP